MLILSATESYSDALPLSSLPFLLILLHFFYFFLLILLKTATPSFEFSKHTRLIPTPGPLYVLSSISRLLFVWHAPCFLSFSSDIISLKRPLWPSISVSHYFCLILFLHITSYNNSLKWSYHLLPRASIQALWDSRTMSFLLPFYF